MNQLPRNSKKGCYCFQKDLEQTFSEMTNFILGNWYLLVKKKKKYEKEEKKCPKFKSQECTFVCYGAQNETSTSLFMAKCL